MGQGRLGPPALPLSDEIIAAGCDLQGLGGFPLKTGGRMRPGTFCASGQRELAVYLRPAVGSPLLAQPSCVQVTGLIESRPYINLTIQAMKAFGVEVNVERIPAKDDQPEVTNFPREQRLLPHARQRGRRGRLVQRRLLAVRRRYRRRPHHRGGAYPWAPRGGDRNVLAALCALAPASCVPPTPPPCSPTSSPALR